MDNIDKRYKNGKIYKLVCSETGDVYYGSTIRTLKYRLNNHRCKSNDCESKYFVDPVIELIEDYPCNNKRKLEKREQYYIDNNDCVNKLKSYITKEQLIEYKKKYREDNKEKLNQKKREKFECKCGGKYTKSNQSIHERTQKHINFYNKSFE